MQPGNFYVVAPQNVLSTAPNGVMFCVQPAFSPPTPLIVLNNPLVGNSAFVPNFNTMPQHLGNFSMSSPNMVPFHNEPSLPPLRLPSLNNNQIPRIPNFIAHPKTPTNNLEAASTGEVNGVRFNIQLEFSDNCTNVDSKKIQEQFCKALQNVLNDKPSESRNVVDEQPSPEHSVHQPSPPENDVEMIDNDQFRHEYWREHSLSTSIRDSLIRSTTKTLRSLFTTGTYSALWQANLERNIKKVCIAISDATERTIAARNLMSIDEPRRKRARLFARKKWAILLISQQFPEVCKDIAMSVFASQNELVGLIAAYLEIQFCHDLNFSQFKVKQSAKKFLLTPSIRKSLVQDLYMLNPFKASPSEFSDMERALEGIKVRIRHCISN